VALAVVVYAAAVIYVDVGPVRDTLQRYAWSGFGVAIGLSWLNYLLRFAKWELALAWLAVRKDAPNLTLARSLTIYLAGLSMSITPGKVGEVLRSLLLKASDGIPFTRTAPVVVADRLTDLVALVLLSLVGLSRYPSILPAIVVAAALVIIGVVILGSPRILHNCLELASRLPLIGSTTHRLEPMIESAATVLRLRGVLALSALSLAGWSLECVGYWAILRGFAGVAPELRACVFLWSASTLVGALSFLPGGLGATEGSLVYATQRILPMVTPPIALAAALLGRVATLWFGELVGSVALAMFLRDPSLRTQALQEGSEDPPPPTRG